MLAIEKLNVAYGNIQVLFDVSFSVPSGSFVGVLGANGAGKSTLLRTISGLVRPLSGRIAFDGVDLTTIPPHRIPGYGIAHVPEGRRVFPSLTVEDNLMLGALKAPANERADLRTAVLDLFPRLRERTGQLAGSLSGGEQQMLAIGRALMLKPKLLMLDEPSLGLAPIVTDEVFDRLTRIHRDWSLSILLIEQNAVQALDVIDSAVIFETGRMQFFGAREQLSQTSYLKEAYLGV
ncbi:ABC transporter ATP-binding protein [bacterium]|nr:MAG: ABC transporter ATP-binding protein [bacterium]